MAIVSLTTIPSRFSGLEPTFEALKAQTARIDEIRLYIPRRYRRFPEYRGDKPPVPSYVRVVEVEEDLGPASKMLFAAQELKNESTPILFVDDDRIYAPNWARRLLWESRLHPGKCIACRGSRMLRTAPEFRKFPLKRPAKIGREHFDPRYESLLMLQRLREFRLHPKGPPPKKRRVVRAGHVEFLFGFGGVLVRPHFIDELFYDIPESLWMVDDIWFSGHLARRGIPIWTPSQMRVPQNSRNHEADPLKRTEFDGAGRKESNRRAIAYFQETYGIWKPRDRSGDTT